MTSFKDIYNEDKENGPFENASLNNYTIVFSPDEQIALAKDALIQKANKFFIPPLEIGDLKSNILARIDERFNVYAIWVDGNLMYIGETKDIKARLRQHLLCCSDSTDSKFEEIQRESRKGGKIEVSLIEVQPSAFRLAVEDSLICALTEGDPSALPWNTKARHDASL